MGALRFPIMPEFCTCGAELPPDARFCHRCGKPQREEIVPETVEPPENAPALVTGAPPRPATAPIPQARPPRVNFHNNTAVRIGLLMAGSGVAAERACLPWSLGSGGPGDLVDDRAGFLSVYIYRRRTG